MLLAIQITLLSSLIRINSLELESLSSSSSSAFDPTRRLLECDGDFDVGYYHACTVNLGKIFKCWGDNQKGQMGMGAASSTEVDMPLPTSISMTTASSVISDLYLGDTFSSVAAANGDYYIWGDRNTFGMGLDALSDPNMDNTAPVHFHEHNLDKYSTKLRTVGAQHICAYVEKDPEDELYCWGNNKYGSVGVGSHGQYLWNPEPMLVSLEAGRSIKYMPKKAGAAHSCVVYDNDDVACWGWNKYGQVGVSDTSIDIVSTPTTVMSGKTIQEIILGPYTTCVIAESEGVFCWGLNEFGQLDYSTDHVMKQKTPAQIITDETTITHLALGGEHSCLVNTDSELHCWGSNEFGQLGAADTTLNNNQVTLTHVGTIAKLKLGFYSTYILYEDGTLYGFGKNENGQLGIGNHDNQDAPVQITNICEYGDVYMNFNKIDSFFQGASQIALSIGFTSEMKDDIQFSFLEQSCDPNTELTNIFTEASRDYYAASTTEAMLHLDIDTTALASSNVYNATTNKALFCIQSDIMGTNVGYDGSFHMKQILLEVELNDNNEITNLVVDYASTMEQHKTASYDVEACLCAPDGDCLQVQKLQQNEVFNVCLRPVQPDVVEINTVQEFIMTQDNIDKFKPVSAGVVHELSLLDISSNFTLVSSIVVSEFFLSHSPVYMTGTVGLAFKTSNGRRRLSSTDDDDENMKSSFILKLPVQPQTTVSSLFKARQIVDAEHDVKDHSSAFSMYYLQFLLGIFALTLGVFKLRRTSFHNL